MLIMPKRFAFVDVGTYDGTVSRQYRQFLAADPQRFYCIEPNPINFKQLQTTMEGFNLYNIAISDSDGVSEFYYDNRYLNASSLYREMCEGKGGLVESTTIETMTMDSFMRRAEIDHIDFLKINCEGGEYKMFSAPTLDFLDHVTYLLISWHGKRDVFTDDKATKIKKDINRILLKCGYRWLDGVHPDRIGELGGRSHELQYWKKD